MSSNTSRDEVKAFLADFDIYLRRERLVCPECLFKMMPCSLVKMRKFLDAAKLLGSESTKEIIKEYETEVDVIVDYLKYDENDKIGINKKTLLGDGRFSICKYVGCRN